MLVNCGLDKKIHDSLEERERGDERPQTSNDREHAKSRPIRPCGGGYNRSDRTSTLASGNTATSKCFNRVHYTYFP